MLLALQDSSYRLLYDVRDGFPEVLGLALFPALFIFLGVVLYRNAHRFESSRAGFMGLGAIVLGGLGTLFIVGGVLIPHIGLRRHLNRGIYRLVQGIVYDFVPGDAGDHRSESWSVRDTGGVFHYSYSPAIVGEGGYTKTAAHGGEIANGKRVRILDVGGRIARLEVLP